MRHFKWIEWNVRKVSDHGLSPEEIEASFDRVHQLTRRSDESFQMLAETPSGRVIWVIWRYDLRADSIPDIFGELTVPAIFVITAY